MWIPRLPIEFWQLEMLMGIALEAGKQVTLDDFMTRYRKMGFSRLRVMINLSEPLKLGVLIHGQERILWQPFAYKNVLSVYYRCGWLGHVVDDCDLD